ncbi:MAG TPA: tRNA (guanine(46)-N(7))-methyltransferase TrmB [Beijerinckiaceae bacterium]|nr:tRNA (guanine(46)-N(7))-methyltransferase TrmB [Beijerinckiaceae bacterium]
MSEAQERGGAFFGRRKGKRLRAGQDDLVRNLLPRLRIDPDVDPRRAFGRPVEAVWLEIGFGGGEHLAAQARAHPEVGFVGCEPFVNGVAKLLATIARDGLDAVRVWDRDATELLPRLPPASIDRAYLLYPDPWPKRRQRKRRFVSEENLAALARVLRPGAELRFATDIDDYAGWALARVAASPDFAWTAERPDDWRRPWPDWPGTRYEAKALREGRKASYLTFRRV